MKHKRIQFLQYLLNLSAFQIMSVLFMTSCSKDLFNTSRATNGPENHFSDFTSIRPSTDDRVILPQGYRHSILISQDDPINTKGDTFGHSNDHIQFFPDPGVSAKDADSESSGFLFVNHEFYPVRSSPKTTKVLYTEKYSVGTSILKIKKNKNGEWQLDIADPANRRYNAMSKMRVDGPAKNSLGDFVTGTMDNCSGGQTPWGTALSGEESIDYGTVRGWKDFNPLGTGWIVEFDPYDAKNIPVKHTALGRFKHENAAITISKSGHAVVYMGEDRTGGGFFKFISSKKFNSKNRAHNLKLLSFGKLFGAKMNQLKENSSGTGSGSWIEYNIDDPVNGPILREAGFTSQEEILLNIARASKILGISELDRPEDCEIHPLDGSIYLALTNNMKKIPPNLHGQIIKLIEKNNSHESMNFTYETFAEGGEKSGFSSPDNLAFDSLGNLWVTTDIFSPSLNKMQWSFNGNNTMLMMRTKGNDRSEVYRFASAPSGSEFTGPWFTKNEETLFLSVQHPGEGGNPSSWPDGKARSSVIAVYKK